MDRAFGRAALGAGRADTQAGARHRSFAGRYGRVRRRSGALPVSEVSAIVLAAGAGSRFGGGKLLAPFGGRALIEATLLGLRGAPVNETIVVVGNDVEGLRGLRESYGVRIAENPDWAEGMATSVKKGLAACSPDASGAVVVLGDQPLVGAKAIERLVEAHEGGAAVAVAT